MRCRPAARRRGPAIPCFMSCATRPPASGSSSSKGERCRAGKSQRLGQNVHVWSALGFTFCGMMNRTYKIGHSRDQASFLPPCLEDYVSRDNPVRAIEAYVDALDLNELGFRDLGSDGGAGQPPYDPGDLLKLYLYGYLHQVRSSRRLEREARRNVELMWLLRGLAPGYRTIANFRKENAAGLKGQTEILCCSPAVSMCWAARWWRS